MNRVKRKYFKVFSIRILLQSNPVGSSKKKNEFSKSKSKFPTVHQYRQEWKFIWPKLIFYFMDFYGFSMEKIDNCFVGLKIIIIFYFHEH